MSDVGPCVHTLVPCISPLFSTLLKRAKSPSAHKMKRYGKKGSLCLRPLFGIIGPNSAPFESTKYLTKETQSMIKLT